VVQRRASATARRGALARLTAPARRKEAEASTKPAATGHTSRRRGRARLPVDRATSAGGIVLRQSPDGLQLVLGKRRRERDSITWTLPKGTPMAGETSEQTALREVAEETGLEVRILARVGDVRYWFVVGGRRVRKTVHYFLMESIGGDLAAHDHEFDEVRWVLTIDAEGLMSFPSEWSIVALALAMAGADRGGTDGVAMA